MNNNTEQKGYGELALGIIGMAIQAYQNNQSSLRQNRIAELGHKLDSLKERRLVENQIGETEMSKNIQDNRITEYNKAFDTTYRQQLQVNPSLSEEAFKNDYGYTSGLKYLNEVIERDKAVLDTKKANLQSIYNLLGESPRIEKEDVNKIKTLNPSTFASPQRSSRFSRGFYAFNNYLKNLFSEGE